MKLKNDLQATIDVAQKQLEQLGEAYQAALQETIDAANRAKNDADATKESLEQALKDLEDAIAQ